MKLLKKILLEYSTIVIYFLIACLIELFGAFVTDGGFYIKDPRYMLTILGAIVCILIVIRNQKARLITAAALLYGHMAVNVIFILVFEMAGQWFDFSMFSLRSDAMGILENIPINFPYTFSFIFVITTYLVLGFKYLDTIKVVIEKLDEEILVERKAKEEKKINSNKIVVSTSGILIALFLVLNVLTGYAINGNVEVDIYDALLHSNLDSPYNQYGATNSFINELYSGAIFANNVTLDSDVIESYLYSTTYEGDDKYFGVSEGNNVITILGETFEWMSFMSESADFDDSFKFVNGASISKDNMREIYPNLYRLYDEGYVLTNYHAREKTDISEAYSIVGSYPIRKYTYYDYPTNFKPQSMPNVLKADSKSNGDSFSSQYFHNGYGDFYNREEAIRGFGFDSTKFSNDMKSSDAFNDYGASGERNFDSEMIDACYDEMFPTDVDRFYTYITTITMHGLYQRQRNNLTDHKHYYKGSEYGCYDVLKEASNGEMDVDSCSSMELSLYTYMAAAMVTDEAIGKILYYLENRGLLDNTTIVLFGDHQAYYEGLSNYVKNIYNAEDCYDDNINYMDLYRVPCMIYDKKLVQAVELNGDSRFNSKFSSSCDIVPTLLDILGIKYYSGFYYGNSVFDEDSETIIYSRGYGYFLDNYSYFKNINKFTYINPVVEELYNQGGTLTKQQAYAAYKAHVDEVATKLVINIKYVDNVYRKNLFKDTDCYLNYYNKMKAINGWTL